MYPSPAVRVSRETGSTGAMRLNSVRATCRVLAPWPALAPATVVQRKRCHQGAVVPQHSILPIQAKHMVSPKSSVLAHRQA